MAKKRRRTLPLVEKYRPPSMRERIRSDSEMMAETIVHKHPSVLKAKTRLARKLERQALSLARTGVSLPRKG